MITIRNPARRFDESERAGNGRRVRLSALPVGGWGERARHRRCLAGEDTPRGAGSSFCGRTWMVRRRGRGFRGGGGRSPPPPRAGTPPANVPPPRPPPALL